MTEDQPSFEVLLEKKGRGRVFYRYRPWRLRIFQLIGDCLYYSKDGEIKGIIPLTGSKSMVIPSKEANNKPFPFAIDVNGESILLNAHNEEERLKCITLFNEVANPQQPKKPSSSAEIDQNSPPSKPNQEQKEVVQGASSKADFPLHGVKFSFLRHFLSQYNDKGQLQGKTTTDICKEIIQPLTASRQCSLCEYLQMNDNDHYVAMIETEKAAFITALGSEGTRDSMNNMLNTVDSQKSEAWKIEDRNAIHHVIQQTVGFSQLNALVFETMRKAFIEIVTDITEFYITTKSTQDKASLFSYLGSLYLHDGNYHEAEKAYQISYETVIELYGENHPQTSIAINNLSTIYVTQGRYEDAEALFNKNDLGSNQLFSMNTRAALLLKTGKYIEAETISLTCIELCKEEEGVGGYAPNLLKDAMGNLAASYDGQRRFSEAEALHSQAIEMVTKKYGENHLDTLIAKNRLACSYCAQGDYGESIQLFEMILNKRKELLGLSHPETIQSMHNLASTYFHGKKYDEGERLMKETIREEEKKYGKDHINTINSMMELSTMFDIQGRYDESIALLEECVQRKTKLFGCNHTDTLKVMQKLGLSYKNIKQYMKSEEILKKCIEGMKMIVKEDDDPLLFDTMTLLGTVYFEMKHYYEADIYYSPCYSYQKTINKDSPEALLAFIFIYGHLKVALKQYSEAIVALSEYLQHSTIHDIREHRVKLWLGSIYYNEDRFIEAEPLLRDVYEKERQDRGELHVDTLSCMKLLFKNYYELKNYQQVEALGEVLLPHLLINNDLETIIVYSYLVKAYENLPNREEKIDIVYDSYEVEDKEEKLKILSQLPFIQINASNDKEEQEENI
eukprot:gene15544-17420_t